MDSKAKTIVVLGSSSFAGSCFCNFLLCNGFSVVGISRSASNLLVGDRLKNLHHGNYSEIRCDLVTGRTALSDFVSRLEADWIIDFANQGMVAPSWNNPSVWFETNLSAKSELVKTLISTGWKGRYLKISTPEVYGSVDDKIHIDAPMNPSTPYAIAHAAFDQYLIACHQTFDLDCIIGRFANFYGEGQQLYRIIPRAMLFGLSGRILTLEGGGRSERAWIYKDDFCAAILKCLDRGSSGAIYHFSGDEVFSIKQIVEKCCSQIGISFDELVKMGEDRVGKDHRYLLDCSNTSKELDWYPEVTVDQGIERVFEWIHRNYGKLICEPDCYVFKK